LAEKEKEGREKGKRGQGKGGRDEVGNRYKKDGKGKDWRGGQ